MSLAFVCAVKRPQGTIPKRPQPSILSQSPRLRVTTLDVATHGAIHKGELILPLSRLAPDECARPIEKLKLAQVDSRHTARVGHTTKWIDITSPLVSAPTHNS